MLQRLQQSKMFGQMQLSNCVTGMFAVPSKLDWQKTRSHENTTQHLPKREFDFSKDSIRANIGLTGMPKDLGKFYPKEFCEEIQDMLSLHFNMHEFLPGKDGIFRSGAEIRSFAVKEM